MKTFRFLLAIAIAALIALPAHAQTGTATVDKPVNLTTTRAISINGNLVEPSKVVWKDLLKHYKATVLVFVSKRCGVTWMYADKIAKSINDYKGKNVTFVGIHSSYEESDTEIVDELKRQKVPLDIVDDKPTQALADYFGASVTPYFVVIDQNGILRYKGSYDKLGGSMPESKRPQYLRPALDAMLAGKPVGLKTTRAIGCEITRRKK